MDIYALFAFFRIDQQKQKSLTLSFLKAFKVQEAVKEASTTASVELVRSLSVHSELILRAALAEHASSGMLI